MSNNELHNFWLHDGLESATDIFNDLADVNPVRQRRETTKTYRITGRAISALHGCEEDLTRYFPVYCDNLMIAHDILSEVGEIEDRISIRASHQHRYLFYDGTVNGERIRVHSFHLNGRNP